MDVDVLPVVWEADDNSGLIADPDLAGVMDHAWFDWNQIWYLAGPLSREASPLESSVLHVTSSDPSSGTWYDEDGDGVLDLLFAGRWFLPGPLAGDVFPEEDYAFALPAEAAGYDFVHVQDFDRDGRPDLSAEALDVASFWFGELEDLGVGEPTLTARFTGCPDSPTTHQVEIANIPDLDGDGTTELCFTIGCDTYILPANTTGEVFVEQDTRAIVAPSCPVSLGDPSGDGIADWTTADGRWAGPMQRVNGAWVGAELLPEPLHDAVPLEQGDVSGDGIPDLARSVYDDGGPFVTTYVYTSDAAVVADDYLVRYLHHFNRFSTLPLQREGDARFLVFRHGDDYRWAPVP